MGFNSVYRCLMDVFPQVDSRLLRAVAIEHSKDRDMAAEIVLSEVLPFLSNRSIVSEDCGSIASSAFKGAENESEINASTDHQQTKKGIPVHEFPTLLQEHTSSEKSFSAGETSTVKEDTSKTDSANEVPRSDSNCQSKEQSPSAVKEDTSKTDPANEVPFSVFNTQSKEQNPPTVLCRNTNTDTNMVKGNEESEELILLSKSQFHEENVNSSLSQISKVGFNVLVHENDVAPGQIFANTESDGLASLGEAQDVNIKGKFEHSSKVISDSLIQENGDSDGSLIGDDEYMSFDGHMNDEYGRKSPQAELCQDATALESEINPDAAGGGLYGEDGSNSPSEDVNVESNEDIKIKQLEEIVEAAKDNKKTLFSAMELVMNMMSRVELEEQAAEQAKEEAARGGLDILVKVEELKQMLAHAKEANDMHAGEVYGEKAILATEMRELQGRLQILADERDKALGILDEMHQTLEVRLGAAEDLRRAAEKQKLEKEESAQLALAEQEAIMEKVVQEAKILQQEADENSKLRDFLMDRGGVVDALQGEISVICQDVRLLKEKFDERVPLSKSISSSQTSCILASSGSSLRSVASNLVLVPQTSETSNSPKEVSPRSSVDGQSPRSRLEEETRVADRKDSMDEGWELFENEIEI